MRTFTRLKKYKAREPMETVALIKEILRQCNISVAEEVRFSTDPGVYACSLTLVGPGVAMAGFGTNGKGMTEEYALASAYGELMERIQNLILLGDYPENIFYNRGSDFMIAPDEIMMNAGEALDASGEALSCIFRADKALLRESALSGDKMPCVPFYDVINDKAIYLPHKSLRMAVGSNGMCAGNTKMEAITQGISEIYERGAVREAYEKNPPIKQIHAEMFLGNSIYEKLQLLIRHGYDEKILDLSMGKKYPVLGLCLEKNGKIAFKAGADPCPVTALERCLTEMFQGNERENAAAFKAECCIPFASASYMEKWMINDEEIAFQSDGSGMIADCLFHPSCEFSDDFKGTDGESEKADYDYLISLTRDLGYGLYVRDWSFLGFPTYQVIIPELSNYDLIYEDGTDFFSWSFERTRFRHDMCTAGCERILSELRKHMIS